MSKSNVVMTIPENKEIPAGYTVLRTTKNGDRIVIKSEMSYIAVNDA